jgi:alpha-glucosidase
VWRAASTGATPSAPIPSAAPSTAGPGAGFTNGEPWLPLVADAEGLCVERQAADPRSTLALVRRLAALRAHTPALQTGAQRTVDAGADVLAWIREQDGERLLACINLASEPRPLGTEPTVVIVLSSDPDRREGEAELRSLVLAPNEAVLLQLGAR